jgi:hypothetical protein
MQHSAAPEPSAATMASAPVPTGRHGPSDEWAETSARCVSCGGLRTLHTVAGWIGGSPMAMLLVAAAVGLITAGSGCFLSGRSVPERGWPANHFAHPRPRCSPTPSGCRWRFTTGGRSAS